MSGVLIIPRAAQEVCQTFGEYVHPESTALAQQTAATLFEDVLENARGRVRHSLAEVDARGIRGWWYLALAILEGRSTWVPMFNLYLETATDWADGPAPPAFVEAHLANEAQRLVLARDPYRWPGET